MDLYGAVQTAYNKTIRHRLPRKYRVLAGVAVHDAALFDAKDRFPNYKQGLIDVIHDVISEDDSVEIVGFGRGVSTVHCCLAGADEITAYEASHEMIEMGRHTLGTNNYPSTDITIQHALVGEAIDVFGDLAGAERLEPVEIGMSDVLVLDCEGAERTIVSGLENRPRSIICETHPEKGAPTNEVLAKIPAEYETEVRNYHPRVDKKKVIIATRRA